MCLTSNPNGMEKPGVVYLLCHTFDSTCSLSISCIKRSGSTLDRATAAYHFTIAYLSPSALRPPLFLSVSPPSPFFYCHFNANEYNMAGNLYIACGIYRKHRMGERAIRTTKSTNDYDMSVITKNN